MTAPDINYSKLDSKASMAVSDATLRNDFNSVSLSIFIKTTTPFDFDTTTRDCKDASGKIIPGVKIYSDIAGSIYTARASVEGIAALSTDDRVKSIQGSSRLSPTT